MPSLANHQSNDFVKLLLLGDAKSGKTGSLVSLVKAGYHLRILDMDNLLDILKFLIQKECPDKLGNVEFRTIRDRYKPGPTGAVIDGNPVAWTQAIKMLDNWKYDDVDLGKPSGWGPDCILVIDSLSRLCDAAFAFHTVISKNPDQRAIYKAAQDDVEKVVAMLTSSGMETNVIVIAHGTFIELDNGQRKIFPQGVGSALSPKIPQYFPSYIRYTNKADKRTIQLISDSTIDLANPRPFAFKEKTLPVETGLAEFFAVLRDPPEPQPIVKEAPQEPAAVPAKPKLALRRA